MPEEQEPSNSTVATVQESPVSSFIMHIKSMAS